MSKKSIVICIVLLLILVITFLGFHFHDDIKNYIEGEGWAYIEPYTQKKIETANYYISGPKLFVIRDNNLNIYDKNLDAVLKENLSSSKLCFKSKGAYTVLSATDKHFVRLYKDKELLWNKETALEIKSVSVNKAGYTSLIFTQNGYKSGVKVFSPQGNEILNIYLASTYAIDSELSDDNKTLYIGEVDFNGINAKSSVKVVDVASNNSKSVQIDSNGIIANIECNNGVTYISTNKAIYSILPDATLSTVYDFSNINVKYANIENVTYPIVFDNDSSALRTIVEGQDVHLTLDEEPQLIDSNHDKVAININDEVWILSNSLVVKKKCKIQNGLIALKFIDGGKELALIYNDKVELLKI